MLFLCVKDWLNDVWLSNNNGTSWIVATSAASWSGRFGHSSVVIGSTIFVMGGWSSGGKNSIFSSIFFYTYTIIIIIIIIVRSLSYFMYSYFFASLSFIFFLNLFSNY